MTVHHGTLLTVNGQVVDGALVDLAGVQWVPKVTHQVWVFNRAVAEYTGTVRDAANSMREFVRLVYQQIEAEWIRAHPGQRLPGSTRTARLRKKRQDAVMRWYLEQESR